MKGEHYSEIPVMSEIDIDYRNKKVIIHERKDIDKKKENRTAFLSLVISAKTIIIWAIIIATVITITGNGGKAEWESGKQDQIMLTVTVCYVTGLGISFKMFPKVKSKVVPKLTKDRPKYKIEFSKTTDKEIRIPAFKNLYMRYRATEEFGKNLERVEIRAWKFKEQEDRRWKLAYKPFMATFFFKEECSKGRLTVDFI